MNQHEMLRLENFDFLARSFARMYALGHPIDMSAITGNMSEKQKLWFEARFKHYQEQAKRANAVER